ncbi:hypothetical protein [Formosa sp. S-31]|uniref:hypothetical protein n=1 Tax=Formosa sp. S-31 TaxID=2790949 RepID=UPI003EB7068A
MKFITCLILAVCNLSFAHSQIKANLLATQHTEKNTVIGLDNLGAVYYCNTNELSKQTQRQTLNYTNLQLGNISTVNTFNPLKINVFYSAFNTVIILDNRLAEIFKIDFNSLNPYRNPTFISTGYDNTIWLFNDINQQLELYDYKYGNQRAQSTPINGKVLDLKSDYNWCWLLTEDFIYQFNYVGSMVYKVKNEGFTRLFPFKESLILQKENTLYYLKRDDSNFHSISLPELLIKQFFVTNESLYIYDTETVYQFQLKTE